MSRDLLRTPLDAALLRNNLIGAKGPWRRLDVVAQTGSTNADLLARAATEDIDGAVLVAEHQTDGRGRNGRTWTTVPRAQITLSVGVKAHGVPADAWGWVPLATGVAVVDAVAYGAGVECGLKWPNDVLVDGKKLAGILAEVAPTTSTIVVGVGLNITLSAEDAGNPSATSLLDVGVSTPDRNRLVTLLLRELGIRFEEWRASGGPGPRLIADYRKHCITIDSRVRAVLPGGHEVVGIARSIDEQGRLCVETDGDSVSIAAGDVTHIRPTR
jgi:BirA family transcriptional regulator, biotin operon repressor / biotin---[acetyl-CoA-carboxylase] ligase